MEMITMQKLRLFFFLIFIVWTTSVSCAAGSQKEISGNILINSDSVVSENGGTEASMPLLSDADAWTEQLLNTISEKNVEGVAALFSQRVQTTTLVDQTINMFEYMEGSVISCEYRLGMTSQANHNGMVKETDVTIDIATDVNEYRLAIRIRLIDESNKENIGITSLYITEASRTDRNFAYWGGYVWNPGINIE
jgi:hypothetical protein